MDTHERALAVMQSAGALAQALRAITDWVEAYGKDPLPERLTDNARDALKAYDVALGIAS